MKIVRFFAVYLTICAVLTTCATPGVAPKSGGPGYATLLQRAETAEADGQYLTAAEHYRNAYAARPGRPEHAYQAAELYARARDYRNASESYALVPADGLRWPLLGLSYGRALKQAGQTRGAERVLTDFIAAYNGTDRSIVIDLAKTELVGLRLPAEEAPDLSVSWINAAVNTSADETGPSIATAERLSFSRRQGGQNRALVSVRGPAGWLPASPPPGFPVVTGGQLGDGQLEHGWQYLLLHHLWRYERPSYGALRDLPHRAAALRRLVAAHEVVRRRQRPRRQQRLPLGRRPRRRSPGSLLFQ